MPGKASQNETGFMVPIGDGEMSLSHLPELVELFEARGVPLIVEHEPGLPLEAQKLYATLGVLVRFVPLTDTVQHGTVQQQ